jgi:hypothetical protein
LNVFFLIIGIIEIIFGIILLPVWVLVCISKPFRKIDDPIKSISFADYLGEVSNIATCLSFILWIIIISLGFKFIF